MLSALAEYLLPPDFPEKRLSGRALSCFIRAHLLLELLPLIIHLERVACLNVYEHELLAFYLEILEEKPAHRLEAHGVRKRGADKKALLRARFHQSFKRGLELRNIAELQFKCSSGAVFPQEIKPAWRLRLVVAEPECNCRILLCKGANEL